MSYTTTIEVPHQPQTWHKRRMIPLCRKMYHGGMRVLTMDMDEYHWCLNPVMFMTRLKRRNTKQMTYQTRSDASSGKYGGTIQWRTLKDAYEAAQIDQTIWKISYVQEKQYHRWLRQKDHTGRIFWSDQPLNFIRGVDHTKEIQKMTDQQFGQFAKRL